MRYPKAAAFFAVFVLALAVFAGGGVYLAAGRDGCAVSGEVLAGDRSYAGGFTVTQRAVVDGHLLINAGYLSADSGPGWSMAETAPVPEPPPSIALKDTDLDYSESWSSGTRHTTEIPLPFAQDIYDGLAAQIGGSEGSKTASAPLGSYTNRLPLHFVSSGISGLPLLEADRPLNRLPFRDQPDEYSYDSEFTLLDVFSLAAPEGSSLFSVLLLNPGYNTFSITMRSDTDFYTYSDCAFAPDGNFYLILDVRQGLDQQEVYATSYPSSARVDGSALPGGGWGVYKIPYEFTGSVPQGERWWAAGGCEVRPDFSVAENIYPLADGWEHASIELSYDGTQLYIFSLEVGTLWLTAIDLASGETVQRLELASAAEISALNHRDVSAQDLADALNREGTICAFDGGVAICTEYEFAAVAVESGGEFVREALFCPRQQSGAPDGLPAAANYYPDRRAFAWDGERVAYLDWDNSSCDARLCVFEDGGLVYCEQFPGGMYAGVDAECTFDISARKETA